MGRRMRRVCSRSGSFCYWHAGASPTQLVAEDSVREKACLHFSVVIRHGHVCRSHRTISRMAWE